MTTLTATPVFQDLDSYLGHFAGDMAERVNIGIPPLFNPARDPLSPLVRDLTSNEMVPYPAQAVGVEGVMRCLKQKGRRRVCIVVGEMGTGKTCIAGWVVKVNQDDLKRPVRWVVTAPNQLVRKWKKHFERIVPGCQASIVRNWKDLRLLLKSACEVDKTVVSENGIPRTQRVRRWLEPQRTEVWILPRDRGKLGYAWSHGIYVKKRLTKRRIDDGGIDSEPRYFRAVCTYYTCPRCGSVLKDKETGAPLTHLDFVNNAGKLKKRVVCDNRDYDKHECAEQLWQAFNGRAGKFSSKTLPLPGVAPRRMAPCTFLRHIGARFDGYIADEVHELKGAGTLQGQMFADLCECSDRIVQLTGTLTGGYAENLLYLMWRTIPHRLRADGLEYNRAGFEQYNRLYGVLQEQKRYVGDGNMSMQDLLQGRGRVMSARTKSLPGISPVLFVNFLLDHAVFLRLADMHAHLPKFHERVHVVRMTKAQDQAMKKMQKDYEEHRSQMRASGMPCRAWSAARAVFLRWPDKPWIKGFTVYDHDENGRAIEAFEVPSLPKREYDKERRVRRIVTRNMIRGRKTWIFTELTGEEGEPQWDWMNYLSEYLQKYGIRVAVLRSEAGGGPKPEDREEWIAKTSPNVDVVISNPALVRTGLDLFDFPSILFAFCGDNTYTLRQASRRAWRLGQQQTCEVDYLVSKGKESKSVQEAALSLMAKKMSASLAIEGDFSSEGLAAMSQGDDMSSQLAKFIDGTLDGLDPATTAFDRYRAMLEKCMPNLATDIRVTGGREVVAAESRRPMPLMPKPVIIEEPNVEAPPEPVVATEPVGLPEGDESTPAYRVLKSLGIAVGAPKPTEAERLFERPHEWASSVIEPAAVRERKHMRLEVLAQALKQQPDESIGDLHRFGNRWVQLVAKRRTTVRERNFEATYKQRPDAWIAFIEPQDDVGPTASNHIETIGEVKYVVSMMTMRDYMAGERTPGAP